MSIGPDSARLTLVVPLRLQRGERRDLRRLTRLLAIVPHEIDIVVSDDTPDPALARRSGALIAARPGARHLHEPALDDAPFSIGRRRDRGAETVNTGIVLFHDVDFLTTRIGYQRLAAFAAATIWREGTAGFFCVPVFFLTALGTNLFRLSPGASLQRLTMAGEAPPRALASRLVLGSSAIALTPEALAAVGGHDPRFTGHGAEDFDLLHRLSARFRDMPPPADYATDYGAREAMRGGFRAYFARCGRPVLGAGVALAHQWHPRRHADAGYYGARAENFARLHETLGNAIDR